VFVCVCLCVFACVCVCVLEGAKQKSLVQGRTWVPTSQGCAAAPTRFRSPRAARGVLVRGGAPPPSAKFAHDVQPCFEPADLPHPYRSLVLEHQRWGSQQRSAQGVIAWGGVHSALRT